MTDQSEKSLRKSQEEIDMALEISRLRIVVSKLLREKHEMKEAMRATSELHDMILRLHERDRQFKNAFHKTAEALRTVIASLDDLIGQDLETDPDTISKKLSVSAGKTVDNGIPADGLHVVKEGQFRWRPMRLLSDGTIEIDTPAGRLRFADQLHAEEYFEAHWPLPEK